MRRNTRRPGPQPPPPPTPRESLLPQPQPAPQLYHHHNNHRDSEISVCSTTTSLCSNRPSSSFNLSSRHPPITDLSYKHSAIRAINAYLASHNSPLSLSLKPLPSAKDITDILKLILSHLHFTLSSNKLEDDLVVLLKSLNCPHKINKSAFRAPGAPHSFPLLLAVIHWLVQLAVAAHHMRPDVDPGRSVRKDSITAYIMDTYKAYMIGDDGVVEELDKELMEKTEKESGLLVENLNMMDEEVKKLEMELEALKSKPSEKEVYESQRKDLEVDLEKFQSFVTSLQVANSEKKRVLEEKEKELAAKLEEIRRTQEENKELKKRADEQGINMRDAERMKRELMTVEREIAEAEASRSSWEGKCWDLDGAIGQKWKELEALSIECNQALRRIKLGGNFQYLLNSKGSSPAEVLGIDYKSTLKPAIKSFAEEIKKTTTTKLEEFIALQQQSKDVAFNMEAKRNRLALLQSHADERARQLEMMRNEIDEYSSRCASEAERIVGEVEAEVRNLDSMEQQALDLLKASELKLQEETRHSKQEIQLCAYELFALIDSVSRYKENVETKISELRKDLCDTTEFVYGSHKKSLSEHLRIALDAVNSSNDH